MRRVATVGWRIWGRRGCATSATRRAPPPPPPAPSSAAVAAVVPPTSVQLRRLFVNAAVPMIGFGIVDNSVLILAGDLIDNTIGLHFGLATMTSAAFGQVVSDVSGVVGGGLVESIAAKFGLPEAGLSRLQKNLRITRFVATAGAAVGVILGCCLGMTTLLFIDPSKKEREKKSRELSSIFSTIMDHSHNLIGADMCSLLFVDREKQELWSRVATGTDGKMLTSKLFSIPLDKGIAGEVVRTGKVISVSDAYRDKRFYQGIDDKLQMRTRSILAVPVKDEAGEVVAVIEMMNKRGGEAFSADDERIVTMLAHHVRVFVQCMEDTP